MPDTLSLSAGVSLGLLAGIVSGVCYLVANGLTWPKFEQEQTRPCLAASPADGVCPKCGGDTCGGLVPCICRYHKPVKFESGAWFLRQVQRAISLMPWTISTEKLEQIDEECEARDSLEPSESSRGELRNVREFLEALSAKLAGGPLESTRVAHLYDHPAYLPPARDGSPSSASSSHPSSGASGAHAQLKRLVARVVEEAAALPALARYASEPIHTPSISSSTYEDLLATAILNKVIERYQTENGSGGRSSGIHSASASPSPSERSSPRSMNSRHTRDITPPLREEDVSDWEEGEAIDEALELPRRVPFPEFGGDIIHHTNNEDRDFDEVSGSDIQAIDGTWEENWLFQRKKIKTIQSVPVPMLVPNSNTEYRALIGDRDADDTTDLSDNASDAEEEDVEYQSNIKKVLNSKHVIGGKTKIDDILDFEPDSLTIVDGTNDFEKMNEHEYMQNKVVDAVNNEINDNKIVQVEDVNNDCVLKEEKDSILLIDIDSGPLPKAEFALKEEIHRTVLNGNTETHAEDLNEKTNEEVYKDIMDKLPNNKECTSTLPSRHEREKEYEETVTTPVQRYADSLRRKHFEDEPQQIPTRDTDKDDELIPGSIAYRERQKWLNCVEMPNNPYSPEAIKKRLSAKNTSSLFDMITSTNNDLDDVKSKVSEDVVDAKDSLDSTQSIKEVNHKKPLYLNTENIAINGTNSPSPSPKILQEILSEEVPQYKRYGRDYYIKQAKASSGGRKKNSFSDTSSISSVNKSTSLDNFDTEFVSPGLLIKQFNNIATNQQYMKFAANEQTQDSITTMSGTNNNDILIEYEDANEQTLFANKPTYADSDTDQKFEEILKSAYSNDAPMEADRPVEEPPKSPNTSIDNSYVSSSSMEDSMKIYKYNVQTGEIVKSKPDDNVSPRYEPLADKNDNIDMPDKNVPGENVDIISQNGGVLEEAVIIEEVREESLVDTSEVEEDMPHYPNVRELAKKFVSMENLTEQKTVKLPQQLTKRHKSKENLFNPTNKTEKLGNKQAYMHSLTARSISKEFREELKLSMATPLKVPGGSKEIPEGIEDVIKESSRPGSPLPEPGTIKTKLAFFESLKSKFSSK